jgi:hypothetical protein
LPIRCPRFARREDHDDYAERRPQSIIEAGTGTDGLIADRLTLPQPAV